MTLFALKVTVASIFCNFNQLFRTGKRVVAVHIVGTVKVLIVVETIPWPKV